MIITISKPYPHEHAARLYEPDKLSQDYHRTKGGSLYGGKVKVPESISIIWGKVDGHPIAQALRFPTEHWTESKAKTWLKDNNVHFIDFHAATGDVKKSDTDILVEAWDTLAENYNHSYKKGDKNGFVNSALFLKSIYDELTTRKDVIFNHTNISKDIANFVYKQEDIRVNKFIAQSIEAPEVNLIVMDKSSTPVRGILKYTLGCIIDKTKAFTDKNIHKVAELFDLDKGVRTDEIVCCKFSECNVDNKEGYFLPQISVIEIGTAIQKKADSSLVVIKTAHESNALVTDKETVIAMSEKKVFNVNVDKQFGVNVTKSMSMIKGLMSKGIVYGIVYPVNEPDADGDYATLEEVQEACWRFMENYQTMNFMHSDYIPDSSYSIVECACALADVNINGNTIKKGDWYIAVKIKDPDLKEMIENGKISAFSMEGSALPGNPIPELEAKKRGI